jgi:hypothetical protein
MTKLNGFSISFSGVDSEEFLKELIKFLAGLRVKADNIHICTENSIMFFSNKKFDLICDLLEKMFCDVCLYQFSQIKTSPTKKYLVKSSLLSRELMERFEAIRCSINI